MVEPPTPLPGGKKRKHRTPKAAEAAEEETPVHPQELFLFENEYLRLALAGLSKAEVVAAVTAALPAYVKARGNGTTLPSVAGGFGEISVDNFEVVANLLEDLANKAGWDYSGNPPDLPEAYPAKPSLNDAKVLIATGIEQLEIRPTRSNRPRRRSGLS